MSVTVNLTLPAQPVAGLVSLIDLGGDGIISPRSALQFRVQSDGDASAGTNIITITMDPSYTAVVNYLGVTGIGALSQAVRFALRPGPEAADNIVNVGLATDGGLGLAMTAAWVPPAIVLQAKDSPIDETLPGVQFLVVNTDDEDWVFKGQLYIYDKSAVFDTGVEKLLAPLTRSSNGF